MTRLQIPSTIWILNLSCFEVCFSAEDVHQMGELNSRNTGVYAYGFERPSAIQQRAIMPVIKGMPRQDQLYVCCSNCLP